MLQRPCGVGEGHGSHGDFIRVDFGPWIGFGGYVDGSDEKAGDGVITRRGGMSRAPDPLSLPRSSRGGDFEGCEGVGAIGKERGMLGESRHAVEAAALRALDVAAGGFDRDVKAVAALAGELESGGTAGLYVRGRKH